MKNSLVIGQVTSDSLSPNVFSNFEKIGANVECDHVINKTCKMLVLKYILGHLHLWSLTCGSVKCDAVN